MFCISVLAISKMNTNKYKHKITNKIVWTRQWFFTYYFFPTIVEIFVVFNISSSHANTNWPKRRFCMSIVGLI